MVESLTSAVLGLVLTMLIALGGRRLRGTTLVGPWLWGIVSAVLLTLSGLLAATPQIVAGDRLLTLLPYAAEVSTLCPLVALLGARRPQHSAWQFIVATLYVILLVPAVQGTRTAGALNIDAPWSWFLLGLIGVGFVNAAPTRYWPSFTAIALGQLILLAPYIVDIPATSERANSLRHITALALLILAVVMMGWRAVATRRTAAWQSRDPLDRLWLDFRDAYGVLWALRVQQRVNAAAVQFGWPVALAWDGFRDRGTGQPATAFAPTTRAAVEHVLRTLLWRFMSAQMIDERLSGS